ncbi:unnamed protein product [Peniophora sp. CBMAI 1063]|nr:unnamed protein product [Peniophora sp. CBMAI 1063]
MEVDLISPIQSTLKRRPPLGERDWLSRGRNGCDLECPLSPLAPKPSAPYRRSLAALATKRVLEDISDVRADDGHGNLSTPSAESGPVV